MLATDAAATRGDYILVTEGLSKAFGGFSAVTDVNLKVRRGSIHALIGPNGAGKTTCFNMLTKFLNPTRGRIVYEGRDITASKPADVARLGLVQVVPDIRRVSAFDGAGECADRAAAQTRRFLRFLALQDGFSISSMGARRNCSPMSGLSEFANVAAGEMSYGRKRALEIATTLAIDPQMMLLDEPMAGHGPRGRRSHRRVDQAHFRQPDHPDGRA